MQIAPKAFTVLLHLVENRDRMVSKGELLDTFWPPTISDSVLQSTIRLVRQAIEDDGRQQRLIRTHHGRGFRFVAPVAVDDDPPAEATATSAIASSPGARLRPVSSVPTFEERRLAAALACRVCAGAPAAQPAGRGFAGSTHPDRPADDGAVLADAEETFLTRAMRLVEEHGGLVLHTMLDGFTALFAAGHGLDKGTRRAVLFAAELARSAEARALKTAGGGFGVGIDAGRLPVVAAPAAVPFRSLSNSVLKSALSLAERAAPGEAALSARAASHVGPDLRRYMTSTDGLPLDRLAPASLDPTVGEAPGLAHFVGRRAELAFLRNGLDGVGRGRGHTVVLTGEAGIGKSRLLLEFLKSAEQDYLHCLVLHCDPRTRDTPLSVMRQLCRALGDAVPHGFAAALPTDPVDRALWQDLMGAQTAEDPPRLSLSPHMRRQRTFRLIFDLLRGFADKRVVVLAFEDIHWMDATSREALTYLSQRLDGLAVLLIVTTRPVEDMRAGDGLSMTSLWLSPLDRRDSLDLVRSKLGEKALGKGDAEALVQRAGGNPFFLEELSLVFETGADPASDLPDTVQDAIAVRIDRFSPDARALWLATSVIGPHAPADLMARVVDWEVAQFEAALSNLLISGVLVEEPLLDQRAFRFHHILLQEAAYAMLAPGDRVAMHRRIAGIIRDAVVGIEPERLAWHHQEAGDPMAAIGQWRQAARAAHQRSANREAIAFARNGLGLLCSLPANETALRQELELQLTLAPALIESEGYGSDEVGAAYRRARELSRSATSPRTEFRILVGLWNYNWVRGDLQRARRHAEELLLIADRVAEPTLQLRAQACMGEVLFHLAEFAAAGAHLERACALFAGLREVTPATRVPAVACHSYAAWTASFLGKSAVAMARGTAALSIADELVHPFSKALALALVAESLLFEGEVAACLDMARDAERISRREGFPFWRGTALVVRGWAEVQSGEVEGGLAALREGIAVFEATGARVQLANWYGLLAEALLAAGDAAAARDAVDTARDWARRTGDVFFLPRIEQTARALARTT